MIDYHITSNIYLSLEEYTNQGLTQEKIIEIINNIPDPHSNMHHLKATPAHINFNVIVKTYGDNARINIGIVSHITKLLDKALSELND